MNAKAGSAPTPKRRHSRLPGFTFCLALGPLLVVQLAVLWLVRDDAGMTLPDFASRAIRDRLADSGLRCEWDGARVAFSGRVELTGVRAGGAAGDPVFEAKRIVAVLDPYDLIFSGKVTPLRLWLDEGRMLCPAYASPSGSPEVALDGIRAAMRREGDRLIVRTLQAKCAGIPIVAHGRLLPSVARLAAVSQGSGKRFSGDPLKPAAIAAAKIVALRPALKELDGASLELSGTDVAGGVALSLDGAADGARYRNAKATGVRLHVGAFWGATDVPRPQGRATFVVASAGFDDPERKITVLTGAASARVTFGPEWNAPHEADATAHNVAVNGAPADRIAAHVDWSDFRRIAFHAEALRGRTRLDTSGIVNSDTKELAADFSSSLRLDELRAHPLFPKKLPPELATLAITDAAIVTGRVETGPGGAFRRARVRLDTGEIRVGPVALDALSAFADITPEHIVVRDIDGIASDRRVLGSFSTGLKDDTYRVLLRGEASPEQIAPFVGEWWGPIWKDLAADPAHPPYADVDVAGKWEGLPYESIFIGVAAKRLSYHGRTFDRASARIVETPGRIIVGDIVARNDGGEGVTGRLEWDYRMPDHTLEAVRFAFDGRLPLKTAATLGGDDVVAALADISLEKPATASVLGRYAGPAAPGPEADALEVRVDAPGAFTAWKIPGENFRGVVLVEGGRVRVRDAVFRYAGGDATADIRVRKQPDGYRLSFDAAFDKADRAAFFAGLANLRDDPAPKPAASAPETVAAGTAADDDKKRTAKPATLSGNISARIRLPDIMTLDGAGRAETSDRDLLRVPLFGAFTRGLAKMGVDAGNYRFDSASGDFVIRDGKVWFPALTVRGRNVSIAATGRYVIKDDGLQFRAVLRPHSTNDIPLLSWMKNQVNKTTRLFPVDITGTLDKPEWSIDPSPGNLFDSRPDTSLGTPPPEPPDDGKWW